MTLTFQMPADQDWDHGLWDRIGIGAEWERLGRAFYQLGVDTDDSDDIVLEFDDEAEAEVRKVIEQARQGAYGPDCKAYWSAAVEV